MERIEWLEPWEAVGEFADSLVAELHRELCPAHCLYRRKVVALGRRRGRDDVLFRLIDHQQAFAIVHLTWRQESDPDFPWTTLYANLDEIHQRFRRDNQSLTE